MKNLKLAIRYFTDYTRGYLGLDKRAPRNDLEVRLGALESALDHVSIRGLDEMRCWCRSRHIGSDYKPLHDPECLEARTVLGIEKETEAQ